MMMMTTTTTSSSYGNHFVSSPFFTIWFLYRHISDIDIFPTVSQYPVPANVSSTCPAAVVSGRFEGRTSGETTYRSAPRDHHRLAKEHRKMSELLSSTAVPVCVSATHLRARRTSLVDRAADFIHHSLFSVLCPQTSSHALSIGSTSHLLKFDLAWQKCVHYYY